MNSTENLISFLREKIDVLDSYKQSKLLQLAFNQKAIDDLDRYLAEPHDKPLILLGRAGNGKTHLAAHLLDAHKIVSPHIDMITLFNYAARLGIDPDLVDLKTVCDNFQGIHIQGVNAVAQNDLHKKWLDFFNALAKRGLKVVLESDAGTKISLQNYLLTEIQAPEYPEAVVLAKHFFNEIFKREPQTKKEVLACELNLSKSGFPSVRVIQLNIHKLFLNQKVQEQVKALRVNSQINHHYHNHLLAQSYDSAARLWLTERGIGKEAIEIFSIGLSFGGAQLTQKMKEDGISFEYATMANVIAKKDNDSYRELFPERLIFPVEDMRGRTLSFAARNFQKIPGPNYIGPINHIAFDKKKSVFGLKQAMKYITESKQVIVVDGILDMIVLYMSGIKNVVSLMGMTLHPNQARILKGLNSEVICWFTDNTLGWQSMYRAMAMLRNQEVDVRGVKVFCKFSPRTYVQRAGPQAARKRIEKAKTFEKLFNCDRSPVKA